jgi:hypothetical protein
VAVACVIDTLGQFHAHGHGLSGYCHSPSIARPARERIHEGGDHHARRAPSGLAAGVEYRKVETIFRLSSFRVYWSRLVEGRLLSLAPPMGSSHAQTKQDCPSRL